jgi:hypothetical protein
MLAEEKETTSKVYYDHEEGFFKLAALHYCIEILEVHSANFIS